MNKQKQKEPLPLMIVKTILAITVFTGLGTIIIYYGSLFKEYYEMPKGIEMFEMAKKLDQERKGRYDLLEKKCASDSCCLSSLKYMEDNNFKEVDENHKCPNGFKIGGLRCESSLSWCEPILINEIAELKTKGYYQTFSYDSASMAMDCGFIDGEIASEKFQGRGMIVFFPNHSTEKYPKKDEIIKIFITNKKSILKNKFEEVYKRKFPDYCLEDKDMNNVKKNYYALQGLLAFKMPSENQIDINDLLSEASATDNWQTYRNEEFGFEVKYPEDWIAFEKNHSYINIHINQPGGIMIKIYPIDSNNTLNNIKDDVEKRDGIYNLKEIFIDNVKGIAYDYAGAPKQAPCGSVYIFEKNGFIINISFDRFDKDDETNYSQIRNQIISTFKFIEK